MTQAEPTQGFITQVATTSKGMKYTGAMSGIFDPGTRAEALLPNLQGGQLFAYLFRRFGYPSWGWDDCKELTHYLLTTPMPDVFLEVRPYMGGDYEGGRDCAELMFGYCVAQAIEEEYEQCLFAEGHGTWEEHPRYKECNAAFEATMRDLLRPVYVRDVPINCYGRVLDESFEQIPSPEAEPYHAAGYPIPRVLLQDTDRYERFWDALRTLGNGSTKKGIENVLKLADSITFTEQVLQAETAEEKRTLLREAGLLREE